jgi:hypothetical protein
VRHASLNLRQVVVDMDVRHPSHGYVGSCRACLASSLVCCVTMDSRSDECVVVMNVLGHVLDQQVHVLGLDSSSPNV